MVHVQVYPELLEILISLSEQAIVQAAIATAVDLAVGAEVADVGVRIYTVPKFLHKK